jgi:hypothetical protein
MHLINPSTSGQLQTSYCIHLPSGDLRASTDGSGGGWWDEWQHFADQFYSFVESGYGQLTFQFQLCSLLDYEQFVHTLSRTRTTKGDRVKDNAVIWLLTQCLRIQQRIDMKLLNLQHWTLSSNCSKGICWRKRMAFTLAF